MKMMAVIKETRAPGFTIVEKDVPDTLGPNDVFIKVLATSICGTDVHIYKWDRWSQNRPHPQGWRLLDPLCRPPTGIPPRGRDGAHHSTPYHGGPPPLRRSLQGRALAH